MVEYDYEMRVSSESDVNEMAVDVAMVVYKDHLR